MSAQLVVATVMLNNWGGTGYIEDFCQPTGQGQMSVIINRHASWTDQESKASHWATELANKVSPGHHAMLNLWWVWGETQHLLSYANCSTGQDSRSGLQAGIRMNNQDGKKGTPMNSFNPECKVRQSKKYLWTGIWVGLDKAEGLRQAGIMLDNWDKRYLHEIFLSSTDGEQV